MLNHETDVIGNSQNMLKIEQCHCPESFSFIWSRHYLESSFVGTKNCLGDIVRHQDLIPEKLPPSPSFL